MARNHRHAERRDVARQTGQLAVGATTTAAILDTIALKDTRLKRTTQVAGGTLVRYQLDLSKILTTVTDNPSATIWAIVADSDSVIADLPDPTGSTDLDVFAPYLFVTQIFGPTVATAVSPDLGSQSWHIDIKAMRRLEDNQRIFICGVTDVGALALLGIQRFWWKAPAA